MMRRQRGMGVFLAVILVAATLGAPFDADAASAACDRLTRSYTAVRTVPVSTSSGLQSAITNARAGDFIVLADGTYSGNLEITVSGSTTKPIVIKSKNLLGATLTGTITIRGSNIVLYGLTLNGPQARLRLYGNNFSFLRSVITKWTGDAVVLFTAKDALIAYNEIHSPTAWTQAEVTASQNGQTPLRMGLHTLYDVNQPSTYSVGTCVNHNYFHDFPAKIDPSNYNSSQDDAMQIGKTGTGGGTDSFWTVEYNLVDKHLQGHGVIDIKTSHNTIRFNTMTNSPNGRIDSRVGNSDIISANWMGSGTGGMEIHGGFHELKGNVLESNTIKLMAGSSEYNTYQTTAWQRTYQNVLAGNKATVVVGENYGRSDLTMPALQNRIEANIGKVVKKIEQGTIISSTTSGTVPTAVKLTPTQVGPRASGAPVI